MEKRFMVDGNMVYTLKPVVRDGRVQYQNGEIMRENDITIRITRHNDLRDHEIAQFVAALLEVNQPLFKTARINIA
jgi:hypothetical protein